MLILSQTKSKDDLRPERTKYNKPEGFARFICGARGCDFWLEITIFAPKLSRREVDMFEDNRRVRLNLREARNEDPERYSDVGDDYGSGTAEILLKYLYDALNDPPDAPARRIKKRNKRFRVSFHTDFDPLLRSLGFTEGTDDESEDQFWLMCRPEPQKNPTPVGTLRAQVEDAKAEISLLLPGKETLPAWKLLLNAFGGEYSSLKPEQSISEDDLALLGCLSDYPPRYFSWAARFLSVMCPKNREAYLAAALRCIQERSDDAQSEIVMYQSQFESTHPVDEDLQEALEFFGATSESEQTSADFFVSKYCSIAQDDPKKALAEKHLKLIGHRLSVDMEVLLYPQGEPTPLPAGAGTKGRKMSIKSATGLLGVDAVYPPDLIRDFVMNLDEKADRERVAEALEVLSELKLQQEKPEEATKLQEFATFFRETGSVPTQNPPGVSQPLEEAREPTEYANVPPGLRNIGNTCYLNSLLQYFYNVKTVRDLINNFDQVKLELDEDAISKRRTGGSGNSVNLEEAIVARQFVEMLGELFNQLQSTTEAAAQPSQKLANTALSSAKEILSERKPPPLPARPSPAPPLPPKEDTDMVKVSVEAAADQLETASSRSSRTLVEEEAKGTPTESLVLNDNEDKQIAAKDSSPQAPPQPRDDIQMEDAKAPTTLEEKMALVSQRLEESDRAGTAQQDVEEIIGNILEHLMRAIRSDGPMPGKPDLQADKITETFFTMIVNSTAKATADNSSQLDAGTAAAEDILNEETIPERWITAFPHPDKENKVKVSLYAALDRYFTYELLLDGSLARYSTIRSLPPILHICIQRSDASGVKNRNPVVIPEVLYMDRYMEAEKGSPLWSIRRRVWAIKERLDELNTRSAKGPENVFRKDAAGDWQTTDFFGDAWGSEPANDDIYSINLDDTLMRDLPSKRKAPGDSTNLPPPKRVSPRSARRTNTDLVGAIDELEKSLINMSATSSAELNTLRKEVETDFESMQREKYSLHAVICHGGGMSAGHYWVWVRDFKRNVWIKYNDSMVTEDVRDSQAVLEELNDSGDPYYVAYVRDELKHDLVEVPQRRKPDTNVIVSDDAEIQTIEGVDPGMKLEVRQSDKAAEAAAKAHGEPPPPYEIL
ncbi:hypothetical protein DL766_003469 [Monosporascus sp. MC13-8B]|uniref:ubiquitinyl hydrolase 1 n=1 Tax=Monosporascus cannonballus TaxID=155416 RepID=A0ABY0HCH2_9PEZI|nr:hypothetical protein DL762_003806 [Monosporascus cannonballus]RYO99258.1 hypothetical protein DL763_001622 [Monosporascus cannonballus]RYP33438.1 hypothetical protein DL766_003469 [Monosporascus sp. MC13-8B]